MIFFLFLFLIGPVAGFNPLIEYLINMMMGNRQRVQDDPMATKFAKAFPVPAIDLSDTAKTEMIKLFTKTSSSNLCTPDYSQCPYYFDNEDKAALCLPRLSGPYPLKATQYLDGADQYQLIWPDHQKREFVTQFGLRLPCLETKTQCPSGRKHYFQPCPEGWEPQLDDRCRVPDDYQGTCQFQEEFQFSDDRRPWEWEAFCQVSWPCLEEPRDYDYSGCPLGFQHQDGLCVSQLSHGRCVDAVLDIRNLSVPKKKLWAAECRVGWPRQSPQSPVTCETYDTSVCPTGFARTRVVNSGGKFCENESLADEECRRVDLSQPVAKIKIMACQWEFKCLDAELREDIEYPPYLDGPIPWDARSGLVE